MYSKSPDGTGCIVPRHDINEKSGGFFISNPPPYGVRGPVYEVTILLGFGVVKSFDECKVQQQRRV